VPPLQTPVLRHAVARVSAGGGGAARVACERTGGSRCDGDVSETRAWTLAQNGGGSAGNMAKMVIGNRLLLCQLRPLNPPVHTCAKVMGNYVREKGACATVTAATFCLLEPPSPAPPTGGDNNPEGDNSAAFRPQVVFYCLTWRGAPELRGGQAKNLQTRAHAGGNVCMHAYIHAFTVQTGLTELGSLLGGQPENPAKRLRG